MARKTSSTKSSPSPAESVQPTPQTAPSPQPIEDAAIVYLNPAQIQADSNIRYGLKQHKIDGLKQSIVEQGRVLQPIGVVPLDTPANGHTHRLLFGFARHRAVSELNAEQHAGLTIPAIEMEAGDETGRVKTQIAENLERADLSPMDKAIAMDMLLKSGVPRQEVRRIFATFGGRKGTQVNPMSNAMLNIHLRFLELPKAIQEKIHDGRVGVAAAYELGKVAPEKRDAVLKRAEGERLHQVEQEEKDEERYLNAEKKAVEAEAKVTEATGQEEQARAEIAKAEQLLVEKNTALKEIQKTPYLELDAEGKKAVAEKIKAAEADVKGAKKLVVDSKNELAKVLKVKTTAAELADRKRAELEAARKAVKPSKKKAGQVGPEDIKKAAQAEGEGGYVALNLSEIRQTLKDLLKDGVPPRVQQFAKAFKDCFDGKTTTKELVNDLALLTGEAKPAAAVKK